MKTLFLPVFILLFAFSYLQAGFFSNLFEFPQDKKEKQFEQVEEEVIPADEYYNQSDEPTFSEDEKVFSDTPSDDYSVDSNIVKEKNIFLSFLDYPKKVYVNQHFTIKIKAVLTQEYLKSIKASFIGGKEYKLLNKEAVWKKLDDKSYLIAYTFKLTSLSASLPAFKVSTTNKTGTASHEKLKPEPLRVIALKNDELFSNILANDFSLISHHEKKYDEKSNIVLLEINATQSNLEDFHLSYAKREGIDSLRNNAKVQNIFYFAIVPSYQKEFKFKYFNLNSNKFNRISFPIIVSDASVSTQTDLNPQKSKYFLYKVIALFILAFLFLLLYIKYKKNYLLILALGLVIYTVYSKLITNNLLVDQNVTIRILPTQNSTVFFRTSQKMQVKVLLKKNGYTKVLLPDTKIGWIKDDDLSKN